MKHLLPALLLTSTVLAFSVLVPSGLAQTATVQQNVKYTAAQKLVRVSKVNGKSVEVLVNSPLTVVPGDVLSEEVTMQNVGTATLPQVVVTMPIPEGTAFTGVVTPKLARLELRYSADGGQNYGATLQRVNSVTNVRWTISSFKAGETLKLTYRVKVI